MRVGDDVALGVVHEARARRLTLVVLHDARPLLAEELLDQRVDRNDLLAVDRLGDGDDRRLRALDGAHDPILIAHAVERRRGNGRRRMVRAGDVGKVRARVEHHDEAADDGAHEPDDDRGHDSIFHCSSDLPKECFLEVFPTSCKRGSVSQRSSQEL